MCKPLYVAMVALAAVILWLSPFYGTVVIIAMLWVIFCLVVNSPGGIVMTVMVVLASSAILAASYWGCAEDRGRCCEVVEMVESVV